MRFRVRVRFMDRFMARELLPLQKVGCSILDLPILDKCAKGIYLCNCNLLRLTHPI